jgi:hypothetical protein
MKITMLAILFLASGSFAMAQNNHRNAPENVRQSFHKDFPDANNASWSRNNTQWHAKFNDKSADDRGEMVAHYDQNGQYIDSYTPYARQDVPTPVYNSAQRKYRHNKNFEIGKVENPGVGDFFQVRVNVGGKTKTSFYDEQGNERQYNNHH